MSLIEQQLKLIDASLSELEKLKKEVGRLEEIRKEIEETRKGVDSLPQELMDAFEKVKTLSVSFVENMGKATKSYIDSNNNLFYENLKELSKRNEELEKLLERLEKIDLEKHFDKLQKTLADIFGAVNSINSVLSSITQTLTSITQSMGIIQNSIDEKHKGLKDQIDLLNNQISSHLKNQDIEIEKNNKSYNSEFEILKNQNKKLKNETKTIIIMQIIEIVAILSIIIYTIINK